MESYRLLIAVLLSMVVIFVFGVLIPAHFQEKSARETSFEKVKGFDEKNRLSESTTGKITPAGEEKGQASDKQKKDLSYVFPPYEIKEVKFKAALSEIVFSTAGASITKLELLDDHYNTRDGRRFNMVSFHPITGDPLPLLGFTLESQQAPAPADLPYKLEMKEKGRLSFTSEYGPWRIERKYKLLGSYAIEVYNKVTNISGEPVTMTPLLTIKKFKQQKRSGGIMGFLNPSRDISSGLCNAGGKTERKDIGKLYKDPLVNSGNVGFVAVDDLYFISTIVPLKAKTAKDKLEKTATFYEEPYYGCKVTVEENGIMTGQLIWHELKLLPGESAELKAAAYIGPKEYERLNEFGHDMKTAIDYGWFGSLAVFFLTVLKTFNSWVGNWGLAIILLTIVIKIILFPLTHWSYVSMRNMASIKPLIDEINRKYSKPEDRDKKNKAIFELYRTHKINPMMGCLPMLLQMPIWIALYQMLARSVELYQTKFMLWIDDLSQRDPYFILPLLLGVSMFIQQKMTPQTADSQQAKMMLYFMPAMFTVFMLFLPSGLNLYIMVSTVLTILQQKFFYKPKVVTASQMSVRLMADMGKGEEPSDKKIK